LWIDAGAGANLRRATSALRWTDESTPLLRLRRENGLLFGAAKFQHASQCHCCSHGAAEPDFAIAPSFFPAGSVDSAAGFRFRHRDSLQTGSHADLRPRLRPPHLILPG